MTGILEDIRDQRVPKMTALKDFLSTSTIHGFSHIGSARSLTAKIFWMGVVIVSFSAAIYLISSCYTGWMDSPVSSMTTTCPISNLDFPEVTVCPPKGSNTVLNLVLNQVRDEKLAPGIQQRLKGVIWKTFVEKPSKMFVKDMTHLMNIQSLKDLFDGTASLPEKNSRNDGGENAMSIKTSLSNGNYSTPGFDNKEYKGDFYRTSHLIHFQLNVSSDNGKSLMVNVDAAEGVEWLYSKQEKRMKLYPNNLNSSEAERFCDNLGGQILLLLNLKQ